MGLDYLHWRGEQGTKFDRVPGPHRCADSPLDEGPATVQQISHRQKLHPLFKTVGKLIHVSLTQMKHTVRKMKVYSLRWVGCQNPNLFILKDVGILIPKYASNQSWVLET